MSNIPPPVCAHSRLMVGHPPSVSTRARGARVNVPVGLRPAPECTLRARPVSINSVREACSERNPRVDVCQGGAVLEATALPSHPLNIADRYSDGPYASHPFAFFVFGFLRRHSLRRIGVPAMGVISSRYFFPVHGR